jgi:hypothetical protein
MHLFLLIIILLAVIISSYIIYILLKSKDNFTIDPNIKLVDKIIDLRPASASPSNTNYIISRAGDLLYSLGNLPPNSPFDLTFNDFVLSLRSDENGNYTFIEPLPVYLLPYNDIRISLMEETSNTKGYYKNYVNASDRQKLSDVIDINIILTERRFNNNINRKFVINDGALQVNN